MGTMLELKDGTVVPVNSLDDLLQIVEDRLGKETRDAMERWIEELREALALDG